MDLVRRFIRRGSQSGPPAAPPPAPLSLAHRPLTRPNPASLLRLLQANQTSGDWAEAYRGKPRPVANSNWPFPPQEMATDPFIVPSPFGASLMAQCARVNRRACLMFASC